MIMLSNEDYEYVKQYASTYEKAYKQNYSHILPRSVNEKLNEIIKGPKKNWGCSACCLTLYRTLYTILKNEDAIRERKKMEDKEKMAKVREAKKNKQITEKENAKEKRPEQSDE